jgi:hypothetical protein
MKKIALIFGVTGQDMVTQEINNINDTKKK